MEKGACLSAPVAVEQYSILLPWLATYGIPFIAHNVESRPALPHIPRSLSDGS